MQVVAVPAVKFSPTAGAAGVRVRVPVLVSSSAVETSASVKTASIRGGPIEVAIIVIPEYGEATRSGTMTRPGDPTRTGARVSAAAVSHRHALGPASRSAGDHQREDENANHQPTDYNPSHNYLRRAVGSIHGGSQPVSAGSMNVPGSTTSSIASSTSSSRRRSAADSRSSSCSIVRGPMIAEVTAG